MTNYVWCIALSCLALLVLADLVRENGQIGGPVKKRLYLSCLVISVSSLAELGSVALNQAPDWTRTLHAAVKCVDYIVTPWAATCFVLQLSPERRNERWFVALLIANSGIQVLSIFTGWTFYIDETNVYRHGPYYFIYIAVYAVAVLRTLYCFYCYGRRFSKSNALSLLGIMALVSLGVLAQEIGGKDVRTCCLGLAFGAILMFIHFSEFSQQEREETFHRQHRLLETDPLTGLFNRYAYNEALSVADAQEELPRDTVIFSIDANGLKLAIDTMGHLAGDELIRGAAQCIDRVLSPYGRCYRTGGDEYVAIVRMNAENLASALQALQEETRRWKGEQVSEMSLSVGYAAAREYPELGLEKLFGIADRAMYESKARYYRESGRERRRR